MFKKLIVAAAILIASPAFVSAQDIFWSFSPTEANSTSNEFYDVGDTGSIYIFSDGLFGFDAIDLDFITSDSNVIRLTGGEAINPTFNFFGGTTFNLSEVTVDAVDGSGNLFAVNVNQNGVVPAESALNNPAFEAGVGPNGAVLLARVDFEVVGFGNGDVNFEFALSPTGAFQFPDIVLDPSFGSATLNLVLPPLTPYCPFADPGEEEFCIPVSMDYSLGDVNLSGFPIGNGYIDTNYSVDLFDIAPLIEILAAGGYQREADCNADGLVNFLDIAPFIEILLADPIF